MTAEGVGQRKRWLQKEWGREKVAATKIVEKANPEKREKVEKEGGKIREREKRRGVLAGGQDLRRKVIPRRKRRGYSFS